MANTIIIQYGNACLRGAAGEKKANIGVIQYENACLRGAVGVFLLPIKFWCVLISFNFQNPINVGVFLLVSEILQ